MYRSTYNRRCKGGDLFPEKGFWDPWCERGGRKSRVVGSLTTVPGGGEDTFKGPVTENYYYSAIPLRYGARETGRKTEPRLPGSGVFVYGGPEVEGNFAMSMGWGGGSSSSVPDLDGNSNDK